MRNSRVIVIIVAAAIPVIITVVAVFAGPTACSKRAEVMRRSGRGARARP